MQFSSLVKSISVALYLSYYLTSICAVEVISVTLLKITFI